MIIKFYVLNIYARKNCHRIRYDRGVLHGAWTLDKGLRMQKLDPSKNIHKYVAKISNHDQRTRVVHNINEKTLQVPLGWKLSTLEESGAFEEDLCSSSIHVTKTFFISIHGTRVGWKKTKKLLTETWKFKGGYLFNSRCVVFYNR